MKNTAEFWNRMADRYAKRPVPDEAIYQEKLRKTRQYLDSQSSVLEIGCGTGSTAISHAPHVAEIRATDISSRMLEIAREKAMAAGIENIRFEETSFEMLKAPENAYDAVLALSILHLLEDWRGAIERLYRWTKPGGVLVSSTVCLGDMSAGFRWLLPVLKLIRVAPDVRVFKADDVVAALVATGFQIETDWRPGKNKGVFIIARKPA